MPESVGSAEYELVVDLTKGEEALRQFEQQVEQTGRRTDDRLNRLSRMTATDTTRHFEIAQVRALQQQYGLTEAAALATVRGTEQVAATTTKAATAATKATAATRGLSVGQRALNTSLRSGTLALATQIPIFGRLGTGASTLATALPQVGVAVLGAAAGYQVLDMAIQKVTGSGIIDHLTGQAEAHDRAARAARAQAEMEERIARIGREGVGADAATLIEVERAIASVNAKWDEYNRKASQVTSIAEAAELRFPDIATEVQAIIDAKLNYEELGRVIAGTNGRIKDQRLIDELKKQKQAFEDAMSSIDRYAIAIEKALEKQKNFSSALSDAQALLDLQDPQLEALKLEQIQLDQLKTKMGDAFGEANQARLNEVARLIQLIQARQETATQSFALFAAMAQHAYGDMATDAIKNVAAAISALPDEEQIKVAILLPDLFKIQSAFQAFIRSLQAGATVTVAIRTAAVTAFGTDEATRQNFLGGGIQTLPGFDPAKHPSDAALDFEKQLTESIERVNKNAVGPLGDVASKTGAAAEKAAKLTDIWADGIISLAEALEEGLTPAMAAQLELTHDAELAVWDLRDAEFRLQVEREKAARGAIGLQIALVAIAAELIRSKRTFAQFQLDEWLRPQIDNVRSMIDNIFSQPTREGLMLDKELLQLRRQRLLIERRGGDTEKIDARIEAMEREIELRQIDAELLKIETQLKDELLQTDQDLVTANVFLGEALAALTGEARSLVDVFGLDLFNAGKAAAAALNSFAAAAGFSPDQKHWINGVARARGEAVPFPGFEMGLARVPWDTMPVMVHRDEAILNRDQAEDWRRGGSGQMNISLYGVENELEARRRADRHIAEAYRRARYGGSTATSSASR